MYISNFTFMYWGWTVNGSKKGQTDHFALAWQPLLNILRFGSTTSRSLRRGQLPNACEWHISFENHMRIEYSRCPLEIRETSEVFASLGFLAFGSSLVAFFGPPLLKHFSKIIHGAPPARCWWPGKIPTRFPSRPSMKASPTCHGNELENDTQKQQK